MTALPDKLSELMVLALEDLAKVERDPEYIVKMSTWHDNSDSGQCAVCFAGSVMAMSLDAGRSTYKSRELWDGINDRKFYALNRVRAGNIGGALKALGFRAPWDLSERKVPYYNKDTACAWRREMINIAADLAARGL